MSESSTRRLLAWIAGVLGALAALKPMRESDLFWHLALGRAVLRAGRRIVPEPMSIDALGSTRAVPEWLWDVACYFLWIHGGALALTLVLALFGALITSLGWRVLRGHDGEVPLAPAVLCFVLALPALLGRVRERPEVVALALLLGSRLLLRRWAAQPAMRVRTGFALGAVGVLWAQVHGTAPLLAAMTAVSIAPALLMGLRRRTLDRESISLLVGVSIACLTGAHGPAALLALRAHAGGDAVAHLADMHRPLWESFDPTVAVMGPAFVALLALGVGGMIYAGRCWPRRLGYAALGCLLAATAVRGFAPGALLVLPIASAGTAALWAPLHALRSGRATLAVTALALALFFRGALWFEARQGPIGEIGVPPLSQPLGAVPTLRALPRGVAVLASMDASAALGYALDGHARTLVDSRTPMHFDDLQFAVSRDLQRAVDPSIGLRRYGVGAAVVARDSALCDWFARDARWRTVQLAGAWSVFVRADSASGGPTLAALSPCGPRWVRDACSAETMREAAAQVTRLPPDEALVLHTAVALSCGGPIDAAVVPLLTSAAGTRPVAGWVRSMRARVAMRQGRLDDALADALALGIEGRLDVVAELAPALQRAGRTADLRALLAAAVESLDDSSPGPLRADLAAILATLGDFEGARFHATRAAAMGSARAMPVLRWVARRHPDARARADADAWARSLEGR